jgi:hypothetical protein
VVAYLQVDSAEVFVQCFFLTKTFATCVAEMFGLSLVLASKIVAINLEISKFKFYRRRLNMYDNRKL